MNVSLVRGLFEVSRVGSGLGAVESGATLRRSAESFAGRSAAVGAIAMRTRAPTASAATPPRTHLVRPGGRR
jgi:hypothetical protein